MAIAALVCGILGLVTCFAPLGVIGLILGIMAVRRTSRDPQTYGGQGMAIAGIVLGALSMLMFPAIILPAMSRARELSKRLVCASNLKGISTACQIYANDYDVWPDNLQVLVDQGDLTTRTLQCPSAAGSGPAYIYLPQAEESMDPRDVVAYEPPENHGEEGCNVLFGDGHVEFIKPYEKVEQLVRETQERQESAR